MKNLSFHKRLSFALNGLQKAFQSEASFRFQSLAALLLFFVLLVLKANAIWWALMTLTVGAVLTAEMFNTALEKALDRLHPDLHESIGLAKDCAAGAVLVASAASLAVFLCFLWDYFFHF